MSRDNKPTLITVQDLRFASSVLGELAKSLEELALEYEKRPQITPGIFRYWSLDSAINHAQRASPAISNAILKVRAGLSVMQPDDEKLVAQPVGNRKKPVKKAPSKSSTKRKNA